MFFIASKIFWMVVQPLNALCLLGGAGFLVRFKHPVLGQKIVNAALLTLMILGIFPFGSMAMAWLERQNPPPVHLPPKIDGILYLGGMFDTKLTARNGSLALNDQAERGICFAELARKHPAAKLVFSGGGGDITAPDTNESDDARLFMKTVGLDNAPVLYENRARNTYENILYTKELVKPKADENWVVITSAYHMPRTVMILNHFGWNAVPYACDYRTDGTYGFGFSELLNVARNYQNLNIAIKEVIGMVVYLITDKASLTVQNRMGAE